MASQYAYHREIYHSGLNKSTTIKANSINELNRKIQIKQAEWDEQYRRKLLAEQRRMEAERKRQEREKKARDVEYAIQVAQQQTLEAENIQNMLDTILKSAIETDKVFDFEEMKDHSSFTEKYPIEPKYPIATREPNRADLEFNPKPGFWVKLSKSKLAIFYQQNDAKYEASHNIWLQQENNRQRIINDLKAQYQNNVNGWEARKSEFLAAKEQKNQAIDEFKKNVADGNEESVSEYLVLALSKQEVPIDYDSLYEVQYNSENKMVIVDITLPTIENLPKLKSVSYVKSKAEFKESFYSDAHMKKKYDDVIYQMVLRSLYTIFTIGNQYSLVETVVVNGKINTIDRSTGKEINPYVLSVTVSGADFAELKLDSIDPKAWFKSCKGVSAASLATVTPVAPIVVMEKEDRRFVEGYDVADSLNEGVNLAAMDWQDFENLIREVFAKEFNANGGEVKITRASRDGGVDAIAFDPDPIRGGKIVIQAKRYTNVVGVSAVRDLYGTLMNEGAMKGILVSTSNYGNDAYEFAQGKPLQLLNGANLLSLLEKHGHKAKIDLKEAKELLSERR